MTDYQDEVARKRGSTTIKYDVTSGYETADASGLLSFDTGLATLRSVVITPLLITATDACFVQITDYATPSAVTATVSDDEGAPEASVPVYWIALGEVD